MSTPEYFLNYLGVPVLKSSTVALSATSPRAGYRAVGFPLQSLTRNAVQSFSKQKIWVVVYLTCCTLLSFSQATHEETGISAIDTLRIHFGSQEFIYIPFAQFLRGTHFQAEDKQLIEIALKTHRVPLDSVWIEPQQWKAQMNIIELDLHFRSGILKQIKLIKKGEYWEGNLSGRDGTLSLDKTTGRSTFLKWQ
ncbi:MAG: hypothetical protein M3R08_12330 [Bacteroidota bacterium]|nr:hypothetical protein [Bacteroidota bacterium]